ncbi:3-oxoacyl-ACP synthase III family protein [Bacteroidota bacterium]
MQSIIIGTGSYIPTENIHNSKFAENTFYDADGKAFEKNTDEIIQKFHKITDITERKYVSDDLVASDIGFFAAEEALNSSQVDRESLDYLIVAHNFGDVRNGCGHSDFVPSLASRIKHKLKIENPNCVAYDLPFGCPGWLQGMIQADYFLKSGDAKRALIIGTETLSRISDPHDRDSMIYSDGAGATILEAVDTDEKVGILSHASKSYTVDEAYLLWMDKSYNPELNGNGIYLKMNGHKLYVSALTKVPLVVKESIDKAGLTINDIQKVLIHQANAKMDEAILKRLFDLYQSKTDPHKVMPMTISWLGNSSVATVPTLLDMLLKGKLNNHISGGGKNLVFTSVGAGLNINSMVYKMPKED